VVETLLLSRVVDVPVAHLFHSLQRVGIATRAMQQLGDDVTYVANSDQTKREVEQRLGASVADVVYPGVDSDLFDPSVDPAFSSEEPTILFVGRLLESKGIYDLLAAIAELQSSVRLEVIGTGERTPVEQRTAQLGIADQVHIRGEVPHEDLPQYYRACDIFCLPTHYESFGMANLEAMACGKPVLTTAIPGVTAYATHGETAYLVPPGEVDPLTVGLKELLASPELRSTLGDNALTVARQYSWADSARKLVQAAQQILETGPPEETSPNVSR
jgi:glycosyltransferase involved in cell wall biosynthesis